MRYEGTVINFPTLSTQFRAMEFIEINYKEYVKINMLNHSVRLAKSH